MRTRSIVMVVLCAVAACNTPIATDNTTPQPVDSLRFEAVVNGVRWTALTARGSSLPFGGFNISGDNIFSLDPLNLSLNLSNVVGPGTYLLGVDESMFSGGTGTVRRIGGGMWLTPYSGDAGTVTLTTVTPTHLAGTFSFTAKSTAGFGPDRVVSQGAFNLPLSNLHNVTISPDNEGLSVTGSIGGRPFTAGRWYTLGYNATRGLVLSVSDTTYRLDMDIADALTVGTYALGSGTARTFTVSELTPSPRFWGGASSASTGTVTISSVSDKRVTGSFAATLPPTSANPAVAPLAISGSFRMRR